LFRSAALHRDRRAWLVWQGIREHALGVVGRGARTRAYGSPPFQPDAHFVAY